jgi:threonine-phosphate decarboxylase
MNSAMSPPIPVHGGQLRSIARQFRVAEETLLDFSASIVPFALPGDVLEALRDSSMDSKFLATYPDLEQTDLKSAIAAYLSVPAESIAVGNGMMPLLAAAMDALRIRRCLVVEPCFSGYAKCLRAAQVESISLTLAPYELLELPRARILAEVTRTGCDALLLANPQSPSGILTDPVSLQELWLQCRAQGVTLLLDEAFIDFEPDSSLRRLAAVETNVVVLRSLTKFFPMPAMRVAACVTNSAMTAAIAQAMPEWPITSLASIAAIAVLQCTDYRRMILQTIPQLREALVHSLDAMKIRTFPSRANYLLLQFESEKQGLTIWEELIRRHGIVVRSCQNFRGLDGSYVRISIRTQKENDVLVRALGSMLQNRKF